MPVRQHGQIMVIPAATSAKTTHTGYPHLGQGTSIGCPMRSRPELAISGLTFCRAIEGVSLLRSGLIPGRALRVVVNRAVGDRSSAESRTEPAPPGDRRKRRCKSGMSGSRTRAVSSTVQGVTEPVPSHRRPARRAPACRADRPPRSAPPEHRHRRGDRAARRCHRPGRAPGRRAFPVAAPGPSCSRRRLRAAVLITARPGRGRQGPWFTTPY